MAMTPRERYVAALTFGNPDRIPFSPGGPRESTLRAWRTQGLPEGVEWFDFLCETLGIQPGRALEYTNLGADFRMIPQFEEKVLEHKDGHYIVQDWKGNICEISDTFDVTYLRMARDFVTRRWIKCPVEGREDWERMKERYRLDAPGRFAADFEQGCEKLRGRDYPISINFAGPFWQMREWCGFEGLCMMMVEQPELVDEMAAFYREFVAAMLERILARATPDIVHYSEDMAYKAHSMISPAMARRFCKPCWDRWTSMSKKAGVPVVAIDSDGFIGELIPIWIESGVNSCDPIEVAAHNDIVEFRGLFGRRMSYRGGVDKRAMAKGGRVIREELARIEPVVRSGGYIPGCDHGVPSDISWPNFVDYARLLAKMTGWL
ncbi:MAG: uroporphyrinogen decarboxylase family protein [Phycisphaerae bacterium]